jgi:hypothetical protein
MPRTQRPEEAAWRWTPTPPLQTLADLAREEMMDVLRRNRVEQQGGMSSTKGHVLKGCFGMSIVEDK